MSGSTRSLVALILAAAILYGMQRTTPLYSQITSPVQIAGKDRKSVV